MLSRKKSILLIVAIALVGFVSTETLAAKKISGTKKSELSETDLLIKMLDQEEESSKRSREKDRLAINAAPEKQAIPLAVASMIPEHSASMSPIISSMKADRIPWLRNMIALVFVLTLVILVAYGVSRFLQFGRRARPSPDGFGRILQSIPLGNKRHIFVIGIDSIQLIVGASGNQLSLLHVLGDDNTDQQRQPNVMNELVADQKTPSDEMILHASDVQEVPDVAQKIREALRGMKPVTQ